MQNVFHAIRNWSQADWFEPTLLVGAGLAAAGIFQYVVYPILSKWSEKTKGNLDDRVLQRLRGPVTASLILWGGRAAILTQPITDSILTAASGLMITLIALLWAVSLVAVGELVLTAMTRSRRHDAFQPKTMPLFNMVWKILVYGVAVYVILAAWNIDLTTWLASAGVVGIAVGFAAKDTLANLFAGVFILADAPYKIGDYIIIDGETRGMVTDIGLRSSRLLTRDDVEVTVPNAVIANAKIINETGGPSQRMRVRVRVSVSYRSDVELVRSTLLHSIVDVPHLVSYPEPRVRFRALGDSGLQFELLAWIEEPSLRGAVLDQLNERVLIALRGAGVEIPYPQVDLHVRELPG